MSVFLVPNHHTLGQKTEKMELTEEMLSWPMRQTNDIENEFSTGWQEVIEMTYKNALRALVKLSSFDSEFCIQVDLEKQILFPAHRCWCLIFLNQEVVVSFSHDTRYDNAPFRSVFDWPEINDWQDLASWDVDQWKTFFVERITKANLKHLESKKMIAKKANGNLMKQRKQTEAILLAIKNV